MICDKCKKDITDVAYINVRGFIVVNRSDDTPNLVLSAESRDYYKEELNLHDSCYVQLMIDHGKTNLRHP